MKVINDEGYVASNVGLRKGAWIENGTEGMRIGKRERKVEFPNKKRNEKERRPKRKEQEPVAEVEGLKYDENDVFMPANNTEFFTPEELERLEMVDIIEETKRKAEKHLQKYEDEQN